MRILSFALGTLALFAWTSSASAQGLFKRCQDQKSEIENMRTQISNLDSELGQLTGEIADLEVRLKNAKMKRAAKTRQKALLNKNIQREEARHKRMCSALSRCDKMEKQVADLQASMQPLRERLRRIREELRDRSGGLAKLQQDIQRIENRYNSLGCAGLQIGESDQATFDSCAQLSRDWNEVKSRIDNLNTFMNNLRKRYQDLMKQRQAQAKRLADLTRNMRKTCSHSSRMSDLEQMERDQQDYSSFKTEMDKMDDEVKRFHGLKLMKKLKKAPPKKDQKRKRKPRLRPAK